MRLTCLLKYVVLIAWLTGQPYSSGWLPFNIMTAADAHASVVFLQSNAPAPPEKKDNDEKDKGGKSQGNDKGKNKPSLYMILQPIQIGANNQTPGNLIFTSGIPFSLLIRIVDEDGELANADGLFRFTWNNNNYIYPSNPKGNKRPYNTHWDYSIQNGTALIDQLNYEECGIIKLSGMARVKLDGDNRTHVLKEESKAIAFYPHHFIITVGQPAMIKSRFASYTYAGQVFSATLAITAMNGKQPAEISHNYEGLFAETSSPTLSINLVENNNNITLNHPTPDLNFSDGRANETVHPMTIQFSKPMNPQSLTLQYRVHDQWSHQGITHADPVEFRMGRIRFFDCYHQIGHPQHLAINAEFFNDGKWQLNNDEDVLEITQEDIRVNSGDDEVSIDAQGNTARFWGGKIRGMQLSFDFDNLDMNETLSYTVSLSPLSQLQFLNVVPGKGIVISKSNNSTIFESLVNSRILYEKEIIP